MQSGRNTPPHTHTLLTLPPASAPSTACSSDDITSPRSSMAENSRRAACGRWEFFPTAVTLPQAVVSRITDCICCNSPGVSRKHNGENPGEESGAARGNSSKNVFYLQQNPPCVVFIVIMQRDRHSVHVRHMEQIKSLFPSEGICYIY